MSYLNLGSVPLINIKINIKSKTFKEKKTICIIAGILYHKGQVHPPKKQIVKRLDIKIIREYSDRKKKTNPTDEYSVLYPDTSSDSASGKSKGILDVSAKAQIKNKIEVGNKGNINHIFSCTSMIFNKLNELEHITTQSKIIPIQTS